MPRRLRQCQRSGHSRRRSAMPVEFLGIAATNDGSETAARTGPVFDKDYTLRLARAHEENGWDRVLFAYGSNAPDPNIGAAYIASKTEKLQLLLAHRPNVSYPTFAAKTFATVDQVSDGRTTVHFITGGTDHEQQREGDYLTKDERYERTRECMQIVKQAWTSREPFDYQGKHYKFADFVSDVFPVQQPRPRLSFGGSSPAAYAAGGAEADIYCLWGEPLARTAEPNESGAGGGEGGGPHGHAQDPGRVPPDHRADAGAGLGEGARHRRAHRGQGAGGRRGADPAPLRQEPGEHGIAAAHRDRRGRRAVRPGAV